MTQKFNFYDYAKAIHGPIITIDDGFRIRFFREYQSDMNGQTFEILYNGKQFVEKAIFIDWLNTTGFYAMREVGQHHFTLVFQELEELRLFQLAFDL